MKETMKKIFSLCGLVAALLCFTQNANAQYLPDRIHRDGAGFVDERGRSLSDRELIDAVGIDIFEETVLGARKQYTAGRKLLTAGIITAGAGTTGLLTGFAMMFAADEGSYHGQGHAGEDLGFAGAYLAYLSLAAIGVGGTLLSAGIPLKVIGQSRLNWVENDYNERQGYGLHIGAAPHGVGLTLNF